MRHIVLTGVLSCSLLALLAGCDPEPTETSDGGVDAHVAVDPDAGPDVDGGDPQDVDASLSCDCCGTTVGVSAGEGCGGGVCDNWCGHVIPCDDSCDRTTHVCLVTFGGADAGAGTAPTSQCVPRPLACEDVMNCGGPVPDPSCDLFGRCFEQLGCSPGRVIHSGYLVECRGA
jgi:hypothetical protein